MNPARACVIDFRWPGVKRLPFTVARKRLDTLISARAATVLSRSYEKLPFLSVGRGTG